MSIRHLILLAPLALTACGKPAKQPAKPPADAAAATEVEPAKAAPARHDTNLYQVVAMARACVEKDPKGLKGASGSPLVLDKYFLIEPTKNGTWKVTFTEETPTTRPYGRSVEIDADEKLCDGAAIAAPAAPAGVSGAETVLAAATKCASAEPFDGHGTCGKALLLDHPTIHHLDGLSWLVSFPEESPNCVPSGQDLVIAADGSSCSPAPMD